MGHKIRPRTLYHDRDLGGQNFLSCLHHGRQTGRLSQHDAEAGHGKRSCPACAQEVAESEKKAGT